MDELRRHIYEAVPWVDPGTLEVTEYSGADVRIGWDQTFLVTAESTDNGKRSPIGFTDAMPLQITQAQRFKEVLEQVGIYGSEEFAGQALDHPRLKSLHDKWTEQVNLALSDTAVTGVGILWGGHFSDAKFSVKRLPQSKR